MSQQIVLVTGATGNQGGAVVDALLSRGMKVRALVRSPDSDPARVLAERNVELVKGDLQHAASVTSAASGVDAAFVNTTPFPAGVGIEGEIAQGRLVIDALKEANVGHVVYSSVSDADRGTGIPHFESKWDAEQHLRASGLSATVTAPVYFSDNTIQGWNVASLREGKFRQAMPADRKLQVVSVRDIGRFNAAVIARGPSLAGRRINYAGDELTSTQMAAAIAKHSGRDIAFEGQPIAQVRAMSEDLALMFEWFDRVGYSVNLPALHAEFPEVEWMSFADWAGSQDWAKILG